MKRFAFLLLFLPLALSGISTAQAQNYKNSIDYMMDDGKMSPEEMIEEAQYVYDLCSNNDFQRTYFDCRCVSGAFLQKREKVGPMMPQSMLVDQVINNRSPSCANTAGIAGNAYDSCMVYSTRFREFEKDNADYCECVANRVANVFTKTPALSTGYIEGITSSALTFCENPANRPLKPAAASSPTATPASP